MGSAKSDEHLELRVREGMGLSEAPVVLLFERCPCELPYG